MYLKPYYNGISIANCSMHYVAYAIKGGLVIMRIKKIHLKNGYKRFFDLTIDLGDNPKRIIALVGPNGCGKSSVFDGMLFHQNAYGQLGNKMNRDFNYHSMNRNAGYDYHNVEMEFLEGSYQEIRRRFASEGKDRMIFSFRSSYRYNSNLKVAETRATKEIRLNDYGASYSVDIDDKMDENYRRLNIKFNKYLNETDCKPSEAKTKIIGDLNQAIKNCLDIEIVDLGNIESGEGSIYFKKEDHPSKFEFNVLSSGEKEVVDILLDLYLRKDEYTDSIFLIDEPELHLNTSIQKKLLIEINKLVNQNCQIWIATHSIGFMRSLQEDFNEVSQIIEFKKENDWASKEYTLIPMIKNRSNWKQVFSTALDDLTGLISPKMIIYCEGKDQPGAGGEEKGFDAKVYNLIFSEKHNDVLFVSSGGNTELDQRSNIALAILTKVFNDIKILVLKDRDMSSGKIASEEDRLVYLSTNPANHRVLKRFEIENYLFDDEVLKKYCGINGLVFDEKEYVSLVHSIIDDNLKDYTERIKSICGINFSVSPEIFKLRLAVTISSDMAVYNELEKCIFD